MNTVLIFLLGQVIGAVIGAAIVAKKATATV